MAPIDNGQFAEAPPAGRSGVSSGGPLEEDPSGMALLDMDGTFTGANGALCRMLGRSEAELLGLRFEQVTHPEDVAAASASLRDSLAGRMSTPELRFLRADGHVVWGLVAAFPVTDDAHRRRRSVVRIVDVTERKERDLTVRFSEQQFRTLVEASHVLAFVVTNAGLVYVSPAVERFTGYSNHDLKAMERDVDAAIGQASGGPVAQPALLWPVLHPDERAKAIEWRLAWLEGRGLPSRADLRIATKDGESRWLDFTFSEIEFSGQASILGTAFDVTARKEVELALRESEQMFRSTVKRRGDSVFVFREDRICFFDAPGGVLTGRAREEICGMNFWDLAHPDYRELCKTYGRRLLRGESTPSHIEVKVVNKDGEERWVEYSGERIEYDGRPAGLGMVVDITERKEAEESARLHGEELGRVGRLALLGEMTGTLAHQVNQPLTAITGYAQTCVELLRAGNASSANLLRLAERIEVQAVRAGQVVHRLYDFLRRREIRRDLVDVNVLVREAADLAEPGARRHEVTVECRLAEDLPRVEMSSIEIEQVLLNLLNNAIEAVAEVGSDGHQRRVRILTGLDGDCVQVTVSDSGPGIPSGDLDQIFVPFFSTKESGLGMGLGICRSIVEAHGGRLAAESNDDCGATFRFSLPLVVREIGDE